VLGEAEERRVLDVLRSAALARPLLGDSRSSSRGESARPYASAVSSGPAGLHMALRAVAVADGDEVITRPVFVRRFGQR